MFIVEGNVLKFADKSLHTPSFLFDKRSGAFCYGNYEDVLYRYNETTSNPNFKLVYDEGDLMLIKLSDELNLIEKATLLNYFIGVSANEVKQFEMINMDIPNLKKKLKELKENGF